MTKFVKHVSFDDLAPTLIDDHAQAMKNSNRHVGFNNHYLHVPPQFNPLYQTDQYDFNDWSFDGRSGSSKSNSSKEQNHVSRDKVEKMFAFTIPPLGAKKSSRASVNENTYRSRSGSPMRTLTSPRLPPPPEISNLKKTTKSVDEQKHITDYNVADMDLETERRMNKETLRNTQANAGSSNGFTQSAFANLNELEDRLDSKSKKSVNAMKKVNVDENKKTRRSFANMSDKELAELEDFYASQSRSSTSTPTIDKFDFREQNPLFLGEVAKKNSSGVVDPLAAIYPSRPVVTHKAISLTTQHASYEKLVEEINVKTGSQKPEESLVALRTVNCFISGKRYTWSSADWYVENMVQDGDHFVIVTAIPEFEREVDDSDSALSWKRRSQGQKLERMMSDDRIIGVNGEADNSNTDNETTSSLDNTSKSTRIQVIHQEARRKVRKILDYYTCRIKNKIVKITVEMIKEEKLIDAVTKAAALYKPDIQIISTVSTNLQIKFRNGNVKLPFFVMNHYAMPTMVIPYEFIDPKELGEIAPMGRKSIGKNQEQQLPLSKDKKIGLLNTIIEKTLVNPYLHDAKGDVESLVNTENDEESVVGSVNEYFPISPEQKRAIESFEKLGYIRPSPTRFDYFSPFKDTTDMDGNKLHPVSTASSSKRSSRLQYDDGIYKVKSLIDDFSDDEDCTGIDKLVASVSHSNFPKISKTKSMGPISKSTTHSSTTSPPKSGLLNPKHPALSKFQSQSEVHTSSSISKHLSKTPKSEKKGFASFFKKVFK